MKTIRNKRREPEYKIKENVTLKNIFNTGDINCDIINEEEIDGKPFYVIRSMGRILKVSKEAYTINRTR